MEAADRERLHKANYDILQNSKDARVKRRHKKCILEDTLVEERKNHKLWSWYSLITKQLFWKSSLDWDPDWIQIRKTCCSAPMSHQSYTPPDGYRVIFLYHIIG
ncbi:hypothetical protein TNCV_3927781 [Trichonephila clavipes]|nr:hypothetical protein TNCV_3927781 [Trichonephila clavipes]